MDKHIDGPQDPAELYASRLVTVQGRRVLLDSDAAGLYEVPLGELRRRVRAEAARFPEDFMLCLSAEEGGGLALRRGGPAPRFAFTVEGIAMLAAVLGSPLAVQGNINMTRAFVMLDRLARAGAGTFAPCMN
ncbi:MAG: ORF6N domain-containing protein [Elusimicrobia bacterium]|nr:ORF6N domain-containing protein [Elusimicrobiota bacterium]